MEAGEDGGEAFCSTVVYFDIQSSSVTLFLRRWRFPFTPSFLSASYMPSSLDIAAAAAPMCRQHLFSLPPLCNSYRDLGPSYPTLIPRK